MGPLPHFIHHSSPTFGLPYRHPAGNRRRSAPQFSQECNGGMNKDRLKVQGPRGKDSRNTRSAFSVRRSATNTKQVTQNPILKNPCALRPAPCALLKQTINGSTETKRHRQCPDCSYCQECSKDRCRLCRSPQKRGCKKLSMAEQISLYERINRPRGKRKPQSP